MIAYAAAAFSLSLSFSFATYAITLFRYALILLTCWRQMDTLSLAPLPSFAIDAAAATRLLYAAVFLFIHWLDTPRFSPLSHGRSMLLPQPPLPADDTLMLIRRADKRRHYAASAVDAL